ncbi:MAG: thiamine diphosphokinase [Anaerolineales bacterium]
MLRVVIFANGEFHPSPWASKWLAQAKLCIAADGGLRHCQALNLLPDILIGDFDSLTEEDVHRMEQSDVRVERFPARKDETDLELALRLAVKVGAEEVLILGGLGARWDQTFANLLLPFSQRFCDLQITFVDGDHELHFLNAPPVKHTYIDGKVGDTLSLIPLAGDAHGVTTQGLEYALRGETLYFGQTRGVSNVLIEETAKIEIEQGSLLVVLIHSSR